MADRMLRMAQVQEICGSVSRSTVYAWMAEGEFPRSVKMGKRAIAWRESDILDWLESREPDGQCHE